jgi:TonB family protein
MSSLARDLSGIRSFPHAKRPRLALACATLAALAAPSGFAPAQYRSGELPAIPVLAVGGGVLTLEVGVGRDGGVRGINVSDSGLPFADAVIATVKGWRFRPAGEASAPVDSTVLVAAAFRPPELYAPANSTLIPKDASASKDVPLPLKIVTPPFPPRALSNGVVLVEVRVGARGEVTGVKVVRAAPGFDDVAAQAAHRWTFRPAQVAGTGVPAVAYVIFGFPQPVTLPDAR